MTIKYVFIDRADELAHLEKEYSTGVFNFISIIGRRRVGKTRLAAEFIKNKKNAVYFLVPELNDAEIRLAIAERLHRELGFSFLGTPTWDTIFETIFKESEKSKIILILDEFQRFLNINKAVPSILQGYIDEYGRTSKLFLTVMGSSIGMMHRLFDYSSALYGRRTGQLDIQPLKVSHLLEWFDPLPFQKIIELYSIFGGTPKYLENVEPRQTLIENIKNGILSKESVLYSEPEILIKTELPDSATYFNILKLIAQGKTKPGEIAGSMTIKQTSIGYFLKVLENDLGLITREVPITEMKPEKSKKAIYLIKDNFFRFWFRYVYPNKSDIEIDNLSPVLEKIENEISPFIGRSFEGVVKDILLNMNRDKKMPFKFSKIGRWWGAYREAGERKTAEIDLIALNNDTKEILFCETKWQDKVNAKKVLEKLKEKTGYVEWFNDERMEQYCIIAKSFSKKTEEALCFDLKDMKKVLG